MILGFGAQELPDIKILHYYMRLLIGVLLFLNAVLYGLSFRDGILTYKCNNANVYPWSLTLAK
jgi:hypothetical protein